MQNARNSLCRKQWTIFMRKQWTVLINAKNRFYECSNQIWIYSKYDVQRENFINVETDFINAEKYIQLLWNSNMKSIQIWRLNLENTISLGVLWENNEQFFKQWTKNNLRRKESEQFFKYCWTENNFMQNARNSLCRKQWTIFMRKQWTVLLNAENRFYEYSKQIWIYSKYDMQRENFINVETDFINAEKYIQLLWNSNMKSIQIWRLNLENTISLGVLWENSEQFFK